MIKTLSTILKQDKEKLAIPHSVQQAIPIRRVWPDGIFQAGNRFSMSFRFSDINYAVASKEDKLEMFLAYSELLNALDSGAEIKITLNNRPIDKAKFEQTLLIPLQRTRLDAYRKEYNGMLLDKMTSTSNGILQERYITMSTHKRSVEEARAYFARVGTEITTHLARLCSSAETLDCTSRLRLLRDFFRGGEPPLEEFDLKASLRQGRSFKDWLCPDTMEFEPDCFKLGERWGRVLYLQTYASYIKDSMVTELCELSRGLMLSIDLLPVPMDEAVQEIQNKLLGVETNVANWQRKQNAANNFSAVVPYDLEQQRKETKEFLDDLTTRDQRMMFGLITLVHLADSKEQLDADTESIIAVARKHLCQMAPLKWQQRDGLDTALPYGVRRLNALRTLTTESAAVLMPFRAQEILQAGGIYYGQNAVSGNMIVADRSKLQNGHSFRVGVSGSGKSFGAKEEIAFIALNTNDDILILDPESEFGLLAKELGGEVLPISATSPVHINALDMDKDYGDGGDPLIEKSEFILSLFEPLVGKGNLTPQDMSLLDRCTGAVYRSYIQGGYQGQSPTLVDLRQALLAQHEPEAQKLALASELYITGSLNTFARQTNVDTNSRIIVYDIRELGQQLMPIGMVVTLDAIFNRVIRNWRQDKRTWIFADEFYLLFRYAYSAEFFYKLWKRLRKYGGFITGITQNVEELLDSDTARLMLANSEFLVMYNQASTDRAKLAKLLEISPDQLSYVTNAPQGHGLIRYGGNIVPFKNDFPPDTRLYHLMTTKPDEALRG